MSDDRRTFLSTPKGKMKPYDPQLCLSDNSRALNGTFNLSTLFQLCHESDSVFAIVFRGAQCIQSRGMTCLRKEENRHALALGSGNHTTRRHARGVWSTSGVIPTSGVEFPPSAALKIAPRPGTKARARWTPAFPGKKPRSPRARRRTRRV